MAQVDTSNVPVWIDMMKSGTNLNQTSRAFELYWQNREIEKGSGYKPFKRWEYRMRKRVDDQGNLPPKHHVFNTMSTYQSLKSTSGNWRPLGPNHNQTTNYGDIAGVGRLNTIGFDPNDQDTYYVGAPAGSIWKTTDNGLSWTILSDDLPTMGVSAILVDPNDSDRIYVGTGDRDANDAEGLGVYLSTDGGQSWSVSNTGMGNIKVNEFRIHPDSSNIIFAACQGGVYRSDDSGVNWTKRTTINGFFEDLEFKPDDPSVMYAVGGRIYRSTDYGMNWQIVTGLPQLVRTFIAVTPDDPNRVYALLCNQRSLYGFFRSDDAGQSFYEVMDYPNIMGYQTDGSDVSGGQAWYDAGMTADPNDADVVYVAGIHVFKTTDGGLNWSHNSTGVHVDMHYITVHPQTNEIYLCNDGGLYRSDAQNTSWTDISSDMVVGQMYKMGQSPITANTVLTGFQDNGTAKFDGVGWERISGADGMECQADPIDPNYLYSTYQYGNIRQSVNGGQSHRGISGSDHNITEDGDWVTPFTLAEHNNGTMFAGYQNVWRTVRLKESDGDSVLWEKISSGIGNGANECTVIEHSPVDSNLLYVTKPGNKIYRSLNCNDPAGSVTWTELTVSGGSGNVNDMEAHPTADSVLYVCRGNYVLKSVNFGAGWTDITGNLPNITMTDIAYDTTTNEGLYVATIAGVYYKDASMTNWVFFGDGLPATVEVSEIEIFYGNGTDKRIRASTYGRGLWESDGYGTGTTYFPATALIDFVTPNPKKVVYEDVDLRIEFYKNLNVQGVTGFTTSDIIATNATLNSLTPDGDGFILNVTPNAPGVVTISVPDNAAQDVDGVNTLESELFEFYFETDIVQLGYHGPGGVGSYTEMALWLDAAEGARTSFGNHPVSTGENVAVWDDKSGQNRTVIQTNGISYPYFAKGSDGINDMDAVAFAPDTANGTGDYLVAQDIRTGQNFAGFWALQATDPYNHHGWVMSGRSPNGFILHPVRNSRNIYVTVIDQNQDYWTAHTFNSQTPQDPHIHSFAYCENSIARYALSGFDGADEEDYSYYVPGRDDAATVNYRIGWDYNNRYGEGKIGEKVIYNTALGKSHYNIVRNYFGAKFQVDLGVSDLYSHDEYFRYDLAGIGRDNQFDYHLEALGSGVVRMAANSIDTDTTYMLWADNGGGLSMWNSAEHIFRSKRVARTWRIDETNTVGDVEVFVSWQDYPATNDLVGILVSSNAQFSQNNYVYTLSAVGADTLSTTIDFEDDQFFTLISGSEEDFKLINEQYSGLSIAAYPSVSNGEFEIHVRNISDLNGTLSIHDARGRQLVKESLNGARTVKRTFENYESGTYTVSFDDGSNRVYTRVVVVR